MIRTQSLSNLLPQFDTAAPFLILLIDDQPIAAELLGDMMSAESDLDVHYLRDSTAALAMAEELQPAVILLDLIMPGVDGMAILDELRRSEITKTVPVVVLSGSEEPVTKADAFRRGANDYLIKWPDRIELLARLRYHAQWHENLAQRDEAYRALQTSQRKLAESNLQLELLASLDGLTGLANRRCLDQRLHSEWLRAARQRHGLGLLLIDVDFFKQYNDHYGHLAGDDCLRAIAQAVAGQAQRASDLAARFGGEEFVLLIPHATPESLDHLAAKVTEVVAKLALPHAFSPIASRITVSIGAAVLTPHADSDPLQLLALADQALYRAKRQGRNRAELDGRMH